ncbi:MAG: CpsD/CapB family tyrosine-protein kinase [Myxococcota bacterium]|nr:CpsD/CapB family tyrosine-protein kinase [Myxococcota bacterium]
MAKHYEALQRAEAERRRKVVGEPAPVAPTEWDTTPASAPKHKKGLLDKMLSRRQVAESGMETASDLNKRRIAMLQPESFASEQFRTLRGRIDSLATQQAIKTVSIASANSGEGKTMASINLAVVTSMSVGRKVLLVDCDLRQPKIHISLGLEPAFGLSEVLSGKASLEDAVMRVEGVDLDVLPVRGRPSNPSELLASEAMRELIAKVSGLYDQIIFDTPACLGLPDAKTISELSDGVVLVVRAGVTPKQDIETVLEILDQRRVLGLLLNGTDREASQGRPY